VRPRTYRGRHAITGAWNVGNRLSANIIGSVDYIGSKPDISTFCLVDEKTVGQSTGLDDKNDVEIYEGDLVTLEYTDNDYRRCVQNGEVIWADDICSFVWLSIPEHNRHQLCSYEGDVKHREVIGNIYENPELLEQAA
jgi:uncharacterized phage protein (TIGR01671 family)